MDGAAQRLMDAPVTMYGRHPAALPPSMPRPAAFVASPPPPAPWYRHERLAAAVPDSLVLAVLQTASIHLPEQSTVAGGAPYVTAPEAKTRYTKARALPPDEPAPAVAAVVQRTMARPPAPEPTPAPMTSPVVTERPQIAALERTGSTGQPPEQIRISAALAKQVRPASHPPAERRVGLLRRRSKQPDGPPPFWDAEPVGEQAPPPLAVPERRWRAIAVVTVCGVIAVAGAALGLLVSDLQSPAETTAVFNAPMMVLRAAQTGQVTSVAVKPGQAVDPSTLLLTLKAAAAPDPAVSNLKARLDVAQRRLSALDDALTQPAAGESGRARTADLRRQRDAAAAEVSAAQDALGRLPQPPASPDLPVLAGVHGVIWSLEAEPGTQAAIGAPLVRLIDCDHPFFTVASDAGLSAGQAVQVQLPNLPMLPATVRPASGIAEPPDSLVVEPAPGAFARDCPLGASGTMSAVKATNSKRG